VNRYVCGLCHKPIDTGWWVQAITPATYAICHEACGTERGYDEALRIISDGGRDVTGEATPVTAARARRGGEA
jgi:hypothetical protein